MTDEQLNSVEAALGVRLPEAYRAACRGLTPPPGGDWLFADPEEVIGSTRHPLDAGEYRGPALPPRYVAIGDSGAGDWWLLDLVGDGNPVPCLSHETHAVEPEWPSFAAFEADRQAAPSRWERRQAEEAAERAAWWRRYWRIAAVIVLFGFVIPLLVVILAR